MRALPWIGLIVLLVGTEAWSADAYFSATKDRIVLAEPEDSESAQAWRAFAPDWRDVQVLLDGGAEGYFVSRRPPGAPWDADFQPYLAGRSPDGNEVTGRIVFPADQGLQSVRIRIAPAQAAADRTAFLRAKLAHYQNLRDRNVAGAAWFRYQARQISAELSDQPSDEDANLLAPNRRNDQLASTFAMFTGGRAVSENLQLDRALPPATQPAEETVDISTIPGITVTEMNWEELTKDLNPQPDPLAALIPADQHAMFFPSSDAMVTLLDRAEQQGGLFIGLADTSRSESAMTRQRYERQLCLTLNTLSKQLGQRLVESVAITGSDPYLRAGSDLAILFNTNDATTLSLILHTQILLVQKTSPGSRSVNGTIDDVAYIGAVSDDRSVSTYSATIGNAVVVTNSLAQLRRLVAVHARRQPSLGSLREYLFFRDRYRLGDADETALLILSDATIRRWCGPRWRIADSRRTRAAALLSDLQAQHADAIVTGRAEPRALQPDYAVPGMGAVTLTPHGVRSESYGSLQFMTPIAELELEQVTRGEAESYGLWRNGYQRNWRWAFDPIACRFTVAKDRMGIDLTVMPLIASTEYRQFIQITEGASLKPGSGDPHGALAHLALAINPDSNTLRSWGRMLQNISGNLRVEPLAWIGSCMALYADDDPFWKELSEAPRPDEFMRDNHHRLPVALFVESRDPLRLAAFLTAVRAFADQSAPGLVRWENPTHNDHPYVKISSNEQPDPGEQPMSVYYAAMPKALVLSMNESIVQRAMDRQFATTQPADAPATQPAQQWLGSNLALHLDSRMSHVLASASRDAIVTQAQVQAWSNIPILNEWRRLYPDQDPQQVHQKLFHARLIDPAGGNYTWDEQWQTMQSIHFGHPGAPKAGISSASSLGRLGGDFGIGFEHGGLRAKAYINMPSDD